MKEGFLLVISGPAGTGKGTVCNALLEKDKDIMFSVSSTTRLPREGEVDGVNYNFITKEIFEKMVEADKFLEHAYVHTNYYGTSEESVMKGVADGKVVLLEIDVQGALQVKEKHPEVVTIFLLPPSMEELERRIVDRNTETEEEINKRMENAYKEISLVSKYDYYVVNDDLDIAINEIESIVKAEKLRVKRNPKIEDYILEKGGN